MLVPRRRTATARISGCSEPLGAPEILGPFAQRPAAIRRQAARTASWVDQEAVGNVRTRRLTTRADRLKFEVDLSDEAHSARR